MLLTILIISHTIGGLTYRSEMGWRCDADMRKELLIILDEKFSSFQCP